MKRRVRHLAEQFYLTPESALTALKSAGMRLNSIQDQIGYGSLERATHVLKTAADPASNLVQPFDPFAKPAALVAEGDVAPRVADTAQAGDSIYRLSAAEVMAIRRRMAETLISESGAFGQVEALKPDQLESAVSRQFTSGGGVYKYQTVPDVAATLTYGITLNHPFENANKRTALVSMLVLLNKNKFVLADTNETELYDLMAAIASHQISLRPHQSRNADSEVAAISQWISDRGRVITLGERPVRFSHLRKSLQSLGCELDTPKKNYIKIRRGSLSVKVGYPNEHFNVGIQDIKRIRNALELDVNHGVDGAAFYGLENVIDNFVNQYRNVLRRLADL